MIPTIHPHSPNSGLALPRGLRCSVFAIAGACLLPARTFAQAVPAGLPAASGLPTVSVVGSITGVTDAGRTVEVITRAEIDRSAARNVAELLATRAGVDVYGRSPAQADVSMRGATAEQTLILVDGIRVSDAQSSHYALDLAVPLGAIDHIELLKGSASALYGPDAVGGVINIVTREQYHGAELAARSGAWGTSGASALLGATSGGWNVSPSIEYEKAGGWRPGTDHRIGSARFSLLRSKGLERFQMHLGTGIRDFGANDFYGAYDSFERTGATTADVNWRTLAGEWLLTASASTRYHTDRFTLVRDDPSLYENLHRSWQTGGSFLARRVTDGGAVAFVLDGTDDRLGSNNLGSHRDRRTGAAAQFTWGRDTGSTFDLGLRGDHSSEYGGFFSPSVAFSVPFSAFTRFRATASRGFRAPTWTERFYSDPSNIGNPGLLPETFWSGEAGLHVADTSGTFDVAYFRRRAVNLIDWVKPAGVAANVPWQATNVGTADYHGYEASLSFAPEGGASYTLAMMQLSFTDHQGDGLSGKYALRPVTRQESAGVHWLATDHSVVSVEAVRETRFGEAAFYTANARLTYSTDPAWQMTVDATNLANATWLDASGQVVAGRSVYVGVRWRVP